MGVLPITMSRLAIANRLNPLTLVFQPPLEGRYVFPKITTGWIVASLALSDTSGDGLKISAPSGIEVGLSNSSLVRRRCSPDGSSTSLYCVVPSSPKTFSEMSDRYLTLSRSAAYHKRKSQTGAI